MKHVIVSLMLASTTAHASIVASRPPPSDLALATPELADQPLLHGGALSPAAAALTVTPAGLELLSLLVACALPAGVTIDVSSTVVLVGDVGIARHWEFRPLTASQRRHVSACALARISGRDVAIPLSLRARYLVTDGDERAAFTSLEGAFGGDIFVGKAFSCGVQHPPMPDRVCTVLDPAHPGRTLCGFVDLGLCVDACVHMGGVFVTCRAGAEVVAGMATSYLAP